MNSIQLLELSIDDLRTLLSDVVKEHLKKHELDSPEELLTVTEVSSRLKMSKPTILKYSSQGILIPYKIGERKYYLWSEILAAAKRIEPKNSFNS